MSRCCWVGVLAAGMVGAVGAPVAFALLAGVSGRPEPGSLETGLARRLRSLAIPARAARTQNPVASTPAVLAEGLRHFADHCATCHGNDGSGDTELGRNLYPRAPDMRSAATQGLSDGELFYVIENGVRLTGMPAWGVGGHPEETWKLVHFIRHLPSETPDERAEMRELNPRSAAERRELQEQEEFLGGGGPAAPGGGH